MEEQKFLILRGLELRPLGRPARSAVSIPTTLPRHTHNVLYKDLVHSSSGLTYE
jgi:hypothetical protein